MGNGDDRSSFDITQIDFPDHLSETEKKTKTLEYAEKINSYFNDHQYSEGCADAEAYRSGKGDNLKYTRDLFIRNLFIRN